MASAVSIKISASLAEAARKAAAETDRSLTAQVEHWALMGMVADLRLTGSAMMALKRSGGADEIENPADRAEIEALLAELRIPGRVTQLALEADFLTGRTVFRDDPDHPGMVIKIDAEGNQTRGRMVGRAFFPVAE